METVGQPDRRDSLGVCAEKQNGCESLQRDQAVCVSTNGKCPLLPRVRSCGSSEVLGSLLQLPEVPTLAGLTAESQGGLIFGLNSGCSEGAGLAFEPGLCALMP